MIARIGKDWAEGKRIGISGAGETLRKLCTPAYTPAYTPHAPPKSGAKTPFGGLTNG